MQSVRMQRVRCVAAGEQPVRRPCQPPVAAQDAEQLRRQHDIAILAALTLRDANHHPAAVDVGELETGHLGRTQPGGIRRGQRNAMLQVRHCLEEPHHLLGTEHHRQLAWFARIRDPLRQIGPTERGSIEEPQRTDDLVQPRPGDATGNQMQLECAHVLEAKLVGRAAKESTELRDRMHVGSLRRRRQVADRHVLDHPAAERAHIGHLGGSRLWGGLQPHDPGRWETAHLTIDGTSFQKRFSSIKGRVPKRHGGRRAAIHDLLACEQQGRGRWSAGSCRALDPVVSVTGTMGWRAMSRFVHE
jgi:hypothetical protein